MRELSIIVPVYNEEGNVRKLLEEIHAVFDGQDYQYEVIFIDDGSTDRTREILKSMSGLKYIRLRRNFGQTAAIEAGIRNAQHPFIVTMDGDRQNDPADIPRLFDFLEAHDLDAVSGWRKSRKDPFIKKSVSRGAHFLRNLLIKDGIHDSGCTLKLYKRECFEQVHLYGEMHRFIPALLRIKGYQIGEIEVHHRPRVAGATKYNWRRMVKGFIDMISVWFWNKYAVRPLHLLGGMGLISILLGIGCSIMTFFLFIIKMDLSNTVWPLLTAFFLLTGIQLFVSGLIADILVKNYYESTVNKSYTVEEAILRK